MLNIISIYSPNVATGLSKLLFILTEYCVTEVEPTKRKISHIVDE